MVKRPAPSSTLPLVITAQIMRQISRKLWIEESIERIPLDTNISATAVTLTPVKIRSKTFNMTALPSLLRLFPPSENTGDAILYLWPRAYRFFSAKVQHFFHYQGLRQVFSQLLKKYWLIIKFTLDEGKKLALRKLVLLLSALVLAVGLSFTGFTNNAIAQDNSSNSSLILIQSEIAGTEVFGSGVIVLTGRENCQAVTSYEAIKGASRITALAAGYSPVPAKILRFAPDANLALLEIPIPALPAAKLGDSEIVKNDTPIAISYASPVLSGNVATSFDSGKRGGSVIDVINRPGGSVMRLKLSGPLQDDTSGAPVYLPNTNELIAISLSIEAASGHNNMRFAIPIAMAGALSPNIKSSSDSIANIRVLEGEDAPVLEGGNDKSDNAEEGSPLVPIIVGVVVVAVLGGVAYFVLGGKKKKAVEPFSVLPILPEDMPMAFVTAEGEILPFTKDSVIVGRSESSDWCFPESSVSGRHARIRKSRDGSSYELEDLGSSYGTFIRGRRVGRSDVIHPGDIVRFGDVTQIKLLTRAESQAKNALNAAKLEEESEDL